MKIAHFELILKLEDVLERNLHTTFGPEYSLFLNPDNSQIKEVENGELSYDAFEIYFHDEKYSTTFKEDKFWEIMKELEKKETVPQMYKKFETELKEVSPELFKEEFEVPKSYKRNTEYIATFIFIFIAVTLAFIFK